MRVKKLIQDDDAVSPVIGVILMVAITVILAAVIASFVLGLGDSTGDTQPNTQFDVTYDNTPTGTADTLEFVVSDGDSVNTDDVVIRGTLDASEDDIDEPLTNIDAAATVASASGIGGVTTSSGTPDGDQNMNAGQGFELTSSTGSSEDWSEHDLNFIWTGGDEEVTLLEVEGPSA